MEAMVRGEDLDHRYAEHRSDAHQSATRTPPNNALDERRPEALEHVRLEARRYRAMSTSTPVEDELAVTRSGSARNRVNIAMIATAVAAGTIAPGLAEFAAAAVQTWQLTTASPEANTATASWKHNLTTPPVSAPSCPQENAFGPASV